MAPDKRRKWRQDEYQIFLHELQDEQFNECLFGLAAEAISLYETELTQREEPVTSAETEWTLEQHFEPLAQAVENMLDAVSQKWGEQDLGSLTETEADAIDTFIDGYQPETELGPIFEYFFKKIGKLGKKVMRCCINVAKRGTSFVGKRRLGPILQKLKQLIRPLLRKVLRFAIGTLPFARQPVATKLAARIPYLGELEESEDIESLETAVAGEVAAENAVASDITEIQQEFNYRVANVLFAPGPVEQDLEVEQALNESQAPPDNSLAALDAARYEFEEALSQLKEGEDPTPHVERFIVAILPALRIGTQLIGRKRVVHFLANCLGQRIQKFVGPEYAPRLLKALVDVGLRLLTPETNAEQEACAASSVVAATIEETVHQVALHPEYILENQDLLEAYTIVAFENAVAANLPPTILPAKFFEAYTIVAFENAVAANLPPTILPAKFYRKRPDVRESILLRGTWVLMPLGRRTKRYKKYTKPIRIKLIPYKVARVKTFGGVPLSEYLEEQFGLAPGEEVETEVHLYESIPGTILPQITRLEQDFPHSESTEADSELHPLTPEAAEALLGEPGLGRHVNPRYLAAPYTTRVGQRYYRLRIPQRRRVAIAEPSGRPIIRLTQTKLVLDFPKNRIRVCLFLSELRTQQIATRLRQHGQSGMVTLFTAQMFERGMHTALAGGFGRLKIIHEAVAPEQYGGALNRLPSFVPQILLRRLREWTLKGLYTYFDDQSSQFFKAAERPADGVTLIITIGNPPGFAQIRQALRGRTLAISSLKLSDGTPTVDVRAKSGYVCE